MLIPILENIRDDKASDPILIHCITQKGKGLNEEMPSADKLHAVSKFDLDTKIQQASPTNKLSLSKIFGKKLAMLANTDDKILAITAAMPTGTGLDQFMQIHPNKIFDVGIAEQHAVTFSAGLACEGLKPYCAIYSTFLQRAYDQVVHDVAIQKLPVRFIIDRAGFVGADGPTHAGSFDIAFLINLPHFILMAPSDAQELIKMLNTVNNINDQPSAIRFPRQDTDQNLDFADQEILEIGKGRIIQQANQNSKIKIAILAYGTILQNAIKASEILQQKFDLKITIADARFAKPFDEDLVIQLIKTHSHLIIIEEGAVGGFGSIVAQFLINHNLLKNNNCQLKLMNCSDKFIEQNQIEAMQEESGIGVNSIVEVVKEMAGR